jgi:hypothetical protein
MRERFFIMLISQLETLQVSFMMLSGVKEESGLTQEESQDIQASFYVLLKKLREAFYKQGETK